MPMSVAQTIYTQVHYINHQQGGAMPTDKAIEEMLASYAGAERELMAELLDVEGFDELVRDCEEPTSGTDSTS